ncbi:MAG: hypothetical protein ACI9S8_001123 [Chlamydiales bacterium]
MASRESLDMNKAAMRGEAKFEELNGVLEAFLANSDVAPESAEYQLRQKIAQYDNIADSRDNVDGMRFRAPNLPFSKNRGLSKSAQELQNKQTRGLIHRDVQANEVVKGHFVKRLLGNPYMAVHTK